MGPDGVLWCLIVVAFFVLGVGLWAMAPHPPAAGEEIRERADLEGYLRRLVTSGAPPGLSLAVVKDGAVVYQEGFGYADGPRRIRASAHTAYHWWSMTKIVTALAILQLSDQDRLSIRDPVSRYLPWFSTGQRPLDAEPIQIEHLLRHTSGLPDTMPAMIGWVHYGDVMINQTQLAIEHLQKFNRLRFRPGERVAYSNFNYILLGAVIETVAEEPYEVYVERNILAPLGMTRTAFVVDQAMAADEAAGSLPIIHYYTLMLPWLLDPRLLIRQSQGKLLWFNRVYIDATPSTGLIGSAHDVALFLLLLLNGGELGGVRLLSPDSCALLMSTEAIGGRGLGWAIGRTDHVPYLEHPGGGPGFATLLRIYPERKLGFVILANGSDLQRDAIAAAIEGMAW
jgi:CubicO group peptidase (beta-lactamase class C family)